MTITITINKTGTTLETGDFPQVSRDFIFNYGLRQILNDCHASIQRKDFVVGPEGEDGCYPDEKTAQAAYVAAVDDRVKAKLAALESGDLSTRRASGPVDPVARETLVIAKEEIRLALQRKGIKLKAAKNLDEIIAAHVEAQIERLTKEAKTRIAARAKKAEAVDLEALGL